MTTYNLIDEAAKILREGGLVAFPTETVYGLGADAKNEAAVRKIFAAKERPYDHPLIVHIAEIEHLENWGRNISQQVYQVAQAFWPGPLTIIVKKQPEVLDIVTGWQDTIGLRIPRHPIALALLNTFNSGIAAPSANKFTHISPTTAEAVSEELGDQVDLVLDGGDCEVGLESTILDMSGDVPTILRPGMITGEMLEEIIGHVEHARKDTPAKRAPGMHHLHYAPLTKTILISSDKLLSFLQAVTPAETPMAVLAHSKAIIAHCNEHINKEIIHLQPMPDSAKDYAQKLYQTMRMLDHQQFKHIIIEAVPQDEEWEAIRDRLAKASKRT